MTDREAAAGLVERLEKPKWKPFNGMLFLDDNTTTSLMCEAALTITTLLSELERVGKERDAIECAFNEELTERVENGARALKAEALVAEAVQVCEPFADVSDYLKSETEGLDDQEEFWIAIEDHQLYNIKVGSFRAARAFIEKAKS